MILNQNYEKYPFSRLQNRINQLKKNCLEGDKLKHEYFSVKVKPQSAILGKSLKINMRLAIKHDV